MTFCLNDKSGLGALDATVYQKSTQPAMAERSPALRVGRLPYSKIMSYIYTSRDKNQSGLVLSCSFFSLRLLIPPLGIFCVHLYHSPFSWDQLCLLFCTYRTITTHTQTLECLYPQCKKLANAV